VTTPAAFAARFPFVLDDFQMEAAEAVDAGMSVLVAAPTGSGKTVVAEYAIERALARGGKAFYTTPLKALSNQKFGDLVARHGAEEVGLLTGDNTINSEAPVVVMTTEVLRNMLYERSDTLTGLVSVVMDEVHYLQDPYRGAVWEEVLIHLPVSVNVVCLSATISNAEEFGEWIGTLRGETKVIIEERRPVPLEHHYLIGHRLHPMHVEQDGVPIPNPYVISLDQNELRTVVYYRRSSGYPQHERISRPREGHRRVYVPRRSEVVDVLDPHGEPHEVGRHLDPRICPRENHVRKRPIDGRAVNDRDALAHGRDETRAIRDAHVHGALGEQRDELRIDLVLKRDIEASCLVVAGILGQVELCELDVRDVAQADGQSRGRLGRF